MLDKGLLKLLGGNMKYVIRTMIVMLFGMFSNIGVSACIVWTVYITVEKGGVSSYLYPAAVAALCLAVRYICTRVSADLKNTIGSEAKKDLRKKTYDKILSLGVRGVDGMSMAGLTQVTWRASNSWTCIFPPICRSSSIPWRHLLSFSSSACLFSGRRHWFFCAVCL